MPSKVDLTGKATHSEMAACRVHISILVHKGSPLDYPQYRHTALWLQFSNQSPAFVAQIVGAHGFFEYQCQQEADPVSAPDLAKNIDVGYLSTMFTSDSITQLLSRVPVDNADREYNCQTWVQRALEMLRDGGNLSGEAYEIGVEQMVDAISEAEDSEA